MIQNQNKLNSKAEGIGEILVAVGGFVLAAIGFKKGLGKLKSNNK